MRNYQDLTDAEVVEACAGMGPGYVGAYLFERAQWAQSERTGNAYVPSPAAIADLQARGMWREAVEEASEEPVAPIVADAPEAPVKRRPSRPRKVEA